MNKFLSISIACIFILVNLSTLPTIGINIETDNDDHCLECENNPSLNSNAFTTSTSGYALGCNIEESIFPWENEPAPLVYDGSLPDQFTWQDVEGVNWVTSARDQQSCGSCVAFGTISALEAVIQIEMGEKLDIDLSEAHLFYCGGGSCSNGWTVSKSVNYLETYGVPGESCFPYTPRQTDCSETCSDWESKAIKIVDGAKIRAFPPTIGDIQKALIEHGPLVTTFTVYNDFFNYRSGVYWQTSDVVAGGHAVAIVGYDNDNEYWICKNSWGRSWGENGFFRIGYGECGSGSMFNTYYLTGVYGGICELYLPNPLEKPYPVDAAVNVNLDVTLTWEGGDPNPEDSVYYDLYFGEEEDNLLLLTTLGPFSHSQKAISYNLNNLETESIYFWQIIAKDSKDRQRIGSIWHFSTIDLNAPDLQIIAPIPGYMYKNYGNFRKQILSDKAHIYGPMTVKLYVLDDGSGIQTVDIFVDNKLKASLSEEPFEWYWNTFSVGNHVLIVKATDYAGNENEKMVKVETFISKSLSIKNPVFNDILVKLFDSHPNLLPLLQQHLKL